MKLRGESMQAAADAAASGMVSVIGLDSAKVAELCKVRVGRGGGGRGSGKSVPCGLQYAREGAGDGMGGVLRMRCSSVDWGLLL